MKRIDLAQLNAKHDYVHKSKLVHHIKAQMVQHEERMAGTERDLEELEIKKELSRVRSMPSRSCYPCLFTHFSALATLPTPRVMCTRCPC